MGAKPAGTTRVYGQNLGGLRLDARGGDFREVCFVTKETQSDIFAISEHNLDMSQYQVRKLCQDTCRVNLYSSKLTLASTPETMQSQYKPGGTLLLSSGDLTARLKESGTDPMGRWAYQTYVGKHQRERTFVSIYQVCQQNHQPGQSTASAQQISMLRQRGVIDPKPRKYFMKDLSKFISLHTGHNKEIMLVGDFNESIDDASNGLNHLMTKHQLIDVMLLRHGPCDIATYSRGKKRIDYVLATGGIANVIQNCGYEPFSHRISSDHRAMFVDLQTEYLFGNPTLQNAAFQHRDIQTSIPKQVTIYLTRMGELLPSRNLLHRSEQLFESDEPNHQLAEQLQTDLSQFCLSAGAKCRKFRAPAWSVKIATLRAKIGILKRAITSHKTKLDMSYPISIIQKNYGSDYLLPETLKECQSDLRAAQKEVREIASDSIKVRDEERNHRIQLLEVTSGKEAKKQAHILRNQRKAEESRRVYRKIDCLRCGKKGGLLRLDIPEDPTVDPKACKDWQTIDAPDEIVRVLRERNRKHFGQAHGTPWTIPPLSQEIDFCASTNTTEMILEGQYKPAEIDEISQLLIDNLQQCPYATDSSVTAYMTQDEMAGKVKTWRESTSTNPESLHLGHWHAMYARHEYTDTETAEETTLENVKSHLQRIRLALMNYAVKWSYSYIQWRSIVNMMILKDPGKYHIHRLRVIHLYDAGYNLYLSVKWRQTMHAAEDNNALHESTYGGRAGRTATNPPFQEQLMYDISRTSRKALVKFDNDATSCYDRILVSMASIVSRKYGAPKAMVMVMARTLEEAKYKLKTQLGVTEDYYQHCDEYPIYGSGQGSGNSPPIWGFLSSTLFDCFDTKAHGAKFETPDKSLSIRIYLIGFVDDTTGQINDFDSPTQPTAEKLVSLMQHDAQLWNDLLWASGGALEYSKCSYHVLQYEFDTDGSPIMKGGKIGPPLTIVSGDKQERRAIKNYSAYRSHKTLGHWPAPSGNQTMQYKQTKKKSDDFGQFMRSSPLDATESWTFYHSTYIPSVGYPLPNCHFTKKELNKLQNKAFQAIIASCGYNRKTHRSILYGPTSLGGASFRHLISLQGMGQILQFIRTWRSTGQASALLQIAVSWVQYTLGTGVSFLQDVDTAHPHCEAKWLPSLRSYLASIDGKLILDNTGVLPLQSHHDQFLMDMVIQHRPAFKPRQIVKFNLCRMYLQVLTISDIADANGEHMEQSKFDGVHTLLSSRTKLHEVYQVRPPEATWKVWRRICLQLVCNSKTLRLYQPLGQYKCNSVELRQQWPFYFDNEDQSLYVRKHDCYERYEVIQGKSQQVLQETNLQPPPTALPCQVLDNGQNYEIVPGQQPRHPTPHPPPAVHQSLRAYLQSLEPWEHSLFHTLECEIGPYELTEILLEKPFLVASDGSVHAESQGAFGWIISTASGDRLVSCGGPVYGSHPSSYRAEGYGMLSVFRYLLHLQKYCDTLIPPVATNKFQFTLLCDNQSLVNHVSDIDQLGDDANKDGLWDSDLLDNSTLGLPLVPDWDILMAINEAREEIHSGHDVVHIKGHQDDKKPYEDLPLRAQLNIDADHIAGSFQYHHGDVRPIVPDMPIAKVQLQISEETVTTRHKSAIWYAETAPALQEYIQQRNSWTATEFDTINWKAHGLALRRETKRSHMTKLVHDLLPTNSRLAKFGHYHTTQCHRCGEYSENRDHIIRCGKVNEWRQETVHRIEEHCVKQKTDPVLQDILIEGIRTWMNNDMIDHLQYPDRYHYLIIEQNQIGWRQLFSGRMSNGWAYFQDKHLRNNKLKSKYHSGLLWTVTTINVIWRRWHILWKDRNEALHGSTYHQRQLKLRERAMRELHTIYDNRENMLPRDRAYLHDNIEEHHQEATSHLMNWLSSYRPLFQYSIAKAKQNAIQGVRSITTFFQPLVAADTIE